MFAAMDQTPSQHRQTMLPLLKSLQEASKDLQKSPIFAMDKPLLDLEKSGNVILSKYPNLFPSLSHLLCKLKTLFEKLQKNQGYSLPCILRRQIINYRIHQIAYAIETEIQPYIDRESVQYLAETLMDSDDEETKLNVLIELEKRLSKGFDLSFQDLILKAKVFSILELLLCDSSCSMIIQEQVALVIASLVSFNKDVFVGLVLMGPTVKALISMSSPCSIRVLSLLIKFIRIPLVDDLEANREIPRIISLLNRENESIQVEAMDCVYGITYYGRREAIESMVESGLVEKLMKLQTLANQFKEQAGGNYVSNSRGSCPFEDCVTRFAAQLEVGEVLSKKEKNEFKLEILRRVREASVSEAESAMIVAEVLWGSLP